MNSALAAFDSMRQTIAPELDVYLLMQRAAWQTPSRCGAYAIAPHCTGVMRDDLIRRRKWQGYKPAIVFVDAVDDSPESRGIFIHELGHCLPAPKPRPDKPVSERERRWQAVMFRQLCDTPRISGAPPWEGHDLAFIRLALHLHSRAVNAGWALTLSDISAAGREYGLSHLLDYWAALGYEPERMAGATFAEIEAEPAPRAFKELWASDVAKWKIRNQVAMEAVA